jgi:hypothetical protein
MTSFMRRVMGATVLDVATYEDVEADARSTPQALLVVVLSAIAAGIGARGFGVSRAGALGFFAAVALLNWAAWALLTYEIGARLMPEAGTRADPGQLLRTIGFAAAPGVLRVAGVVPPLAWPVFILASVWMLFAMVVAVRQALDYTSTARAFAVCVIGWAITTLVVTLLGVRVSAG